MSNLNYPLSLIRFKRFFSLKQLFQCASSSFSLACLTWPQQMSYNAWKNFLMSYLWFIGKNKNHICKKKKKKCSCKRYLQAKIQKKFEVVGDQTETIIDQLQSCESTHHEDIKLALITILKQFCERKNISQHIAQTIPDGRNQKLIKYSKESIMMSALTIFLFRMGSGNKFDEKSRDDDEKYSKANISRFINSPESQVPVIKTIEEFLTGLEENSINQLMIAFFKDLQQSKFFTQHPQIMPGDFFLLAVDCVHTHTYDHPHHVDRNGNNDCPCCLKRVYNKETDKEYVRWLHQTLVFSFVFMGGLKIPIYSYPIHAKQIVNLECASESMHKQECELVGLKIALPRFREAFPKMKIVLLLDGLYANKPVIRLAEKYRCGYIIVRKKECLSLLARECDECASTSNHKKNCTKRTQKIHKDWLIEQKYEWFNSKYLGGGVSVSVLRFFETRAKEGEETKSYECEWLFSWRLSARNCELSVIQARSRWEIEDLFNSLLCVIQHNKLYVTQLVMCC